MSGRIRGTQIRDDSVTGDDVDESTLVMPMAYHSSGNQTSTNVTYLALPGRNGWSTTFLKREIQLIAPYNGTVTKVFLRPTTGDSSNASYFQVRTNGDGEPARDGENNVVTTTNIMTVGVDEGTTEVVFESPGTGGGPAPIPKGHAFSFAILKAAGSGYGITDAVIIIEWDLSS